MREDARDSLVAAVARAAVPSSARTRPARRCVGRADPRVTASSSPSQPDGTLQIHESITYDFGVVPRHGILRDLVQRERYDGDTRSPVPHQRRDASPPTAARRARCRRARKGPYLHLRIGDPEPHDHRRAPLPARLHRARRAADLRRPRRAVLGRDRQPVAGPDQQRARHGRRRRPRSASVACFAGPQGSALPCDGGDRRPATRATFAQRSLDAGSGLTVVVALPKGTIQPPPAPILETRKTLANAFAITPLTGRPRRRAHRCSASRSCVMLATRRGRDRRYTGSAVDAAMGNTSGAESRSRSCTATAVRSSSSRPTASGPGQVGTLVDEHANLLDVTASIVDLAVRGWLTITELDPETARAPSRLRAHRDAGQGKGHRCSLRAAAAARALRQPRRA